jgi:hypothetical protein
LANVKDEWWHTSEDGRRIGWIWPEDFEAILEARYGHRKWIKGFCEDFGYSRSTVDRWKLGQEPIPKHVAQILEMISAMTARKIPLEKIQADWLPLSPNTSKGRKPTSEDRIREMVNKL